tara:strand:+ start:1354 stop:4164 length:2811 start_codon:yes stop_codon:yes gene_type:complete
MPRRFDFVSPGVQLTEIDQSTVPTTLEGDGPLIVGRALKGPANVPVRVRSYNDFVAIFGEPVYGPTETIPDTWRNGNTVAPQYGAIAAQAWLSSEESPITFIRLLGDESEQATPAGKAGWETANSQSTTIGDNGGAYGLFLINSGSSADLGTGCLAAVWYLATGSIELSGTQASDGAAGSGAAKLIESVGINKYKVIVKGEGSAESVETFSFDPTADDYIRSVFNTDAYKTNAAITDTGDLQTLWLGETFEEQVDRYITTTGSSEQYGIILGLGTLESSKKYWQNNREASKASKAGWFINRDPNSDTGSYSPANMERLFRVVALHEGEEFQKQYYISIEDLALGTSVNPNSTFSLKLRQWSNNAVVETYSNLNLNWSTENHIVKRIGDMNMVWNDVDKKFNMEGEYPNQSDYIRIEMAPALKAGGLPQDNLALPFGFYGPMKAKDFVLTSGSAEPNITSSFALGSGSIPTTGIPSGQFATLGGATGLTASFVFPDIRLTTENTYGSLDNNYLNTAIFGVHQFLSSSTNLDQSYRDVIRDLPAGLDIHGDTANDSIQRSFIFSIDDIKEESGSYYYESGSRSGGNSYTAKSGSLKLLQTARVKKFAAPFVGGFDGVDITELDPFANRNIGTSETANYEFYTLNKMLDIAADVDNVNMDLLAIPGVNKSTITDRMIEVADERQDCLALIDLENAYTPASETNVDESAKTVADVISSARSRNFDSSYAAAYHPWVRVNDPGGNGTIVAVPPTVAAIGAIGKSQKLSYPWFAPAGFNRGGISQLGGVNGPLVTSTAETLNKANRDDLYETNINPIARLQGDFVIFGQKTLQQVPSALDRINVRRLMIFVKKRIGEIADTILFDNNIEATWNRFSTRANRVLGTIQSQGGIVDYKVQLDSSTTTPDLQDRNILYAKVYIKPARAIEFIAVDFIITRSGVQF